MNLLLYIEARQILNRQQRAIAEVDSSCYWIGDTLPTIPDLLNEEHGSPDELEEGDPELSIDILNLFPWFAKPVLNYAV